MSFVSGFHYYVVFVDFSRVSWVYLLKNRTHVLDIIKKFFKEIKIQFPASTCLFRTDNTLEYV